MKWKTLFFISLALWLGTFVLMNCAEQTGTSSTTPVAEEAHFMVDKGVICPGAGLICDTIQTQIDAYETVMEFSSTELKYEDLITPTGVPNPMDSLLDEGDLMEAFKYEISTLRGFQYALGDLKSIIEYVDPGSLNPRHNPVKADSVYLMLAINTSPNSTNYRRKIGSPIIYLDMYFQAKKNGKLITLTHQNQGNPISASEEFDNFPNPCPDSCP